MSAVSVMACLLRLLRWNRESSCCCCPSGSEQVELMHYLKISPSHSLRLSLSPPIHSKSQKAKGHRHNPPHVNNPIKNPHTSQQKHTNAPLPPRPNLSPLPAHLTHSQGGEHTNMHTLVFCSQPSFEFLPMYLAARLSLLPPALSVSLSQTS